MGMRSLAGARAGLVVAADGQAQDHADPARKGTGQGEMSNLLRGVRGLRGTQPLFLFASGQEVDVFQSGIPAGASGSAGLSVSGGLLTDVREIVND